MDERTAEVVKDLAEERRQLGDDFVQLEHKLRDAVDWRTYFVRNPWAILAIAFAGGLLLSKLLPMGSRESR